tara:strand:- start:287 stop:418 length:132 start_codon:yes stop_codon:yes gene_type:complete
MFVLGIATRWLVAPAAFCPSVNNRRVGSIGSTTTELLIRATDG